MVVSIRLFFVILFITLAVSGCGLFSSATVDEAPSETPEPVKEASKSESSVVTHFQSRTTASPATTSSSEGQRKSLELVWRVPGEAVEKYHIYYGPKSNPTENHLVVPVKELEKFTHPLDGPAFRYVLNDIKNKHVLVVTLQAENYFGMSKKSERIEIKISPSKAN